MSSSLPPPATPPSFHNHTGRRSEQRGNCSEAWGARAVGGRFALLRIGRHLFMLKVMLLHYLLLS